MIPCSIVFWGPGVSNGVDDIQFWGTMAVNIISS